MTVFNEIINENNNFLEQLAYSEVIWNNITINSINEQYSIFKEESAEGIRDEKAQIENRKSFIQRIIDFFRNMVQKIANLIANIISKLTNVQGMMQSFVAAHKKEILQGAASGNIKVQIHVWKGTLADVNELNTINMNLSKDNMDSFEEKFNQSLAGILNEEKGIVEITVNPSIAGKAIANVHTCLNTIARVKRNMILNQQNYKKAESLAKSAINKLPDGEEYEKIKTEIELYKNLNAIASRCNTKLNSILTKLLSDSHKINKACLSSAKKEKIQQKKEQKVQNKIEKAEKFVEKNKK